MVATRTLNDCNGINSFQKAAIKIKQIRKSNIDKNGKNSYQRAAIKGVETKYSIIDENGLNLNILASKKAYATMLKDIDENGLNGKQRASIRCVNTKTNTVNEKGLNLNKLGSINAHCTMRKRIDENGLSGQQRAARKGNITRLKDIDENGFNGNQRLGMKGAKTLKLRHLKFISSVDLPITLYIVEDVQSNLIKIGWSGDYETRIQHIEFSLKCSVNLLYKFSGTYTMIRQLEILLHKNFDEFNIVREHGVAGRTEWFKRECLADVILNIQSFTATIKENL